METQDDLVLVSKVLLQEDESSHAIILKEEEPDRRYFEMSVGPLEFMAIAKEQGKIHPPRPLTHDLYLSLLEGLDIKLERVEIHDQRAGAYIASVVCTKDGQPARIDARPSDSLALALNRKLPIYVHRKLFKTEPTKEDLDLYDELCKVVRFK
ncbi:MAG: bifunctional nuclease family protein [Pseudomonadota bacterium]